jgi:hypothetical protein
MTSPPAGVSGQSSRLESLPLPEPLEWDSLGDGVGDELRWSRSEPDPRRWEDDEDGLGVGREVRATLGVVGAGLVRARVGLLAGRSLEPDVAVASGSGSALGEASGDGVLLGSAAGVVVATAPWDGAVASPGACSTTGMKDFARPKGDGATLRRTTVLIAAAEPAATSTPATDSAVTRPARPITNPFIAP